MNRSELIDEAIADHADWRRRTLAEIRRIIREPRGCPPQPGEAVV